MKKILALCLTVVLCVCCLASCGIFGSHSISYADKGTERLLHDGYAPKRANPGDTVVLRAGPIMDADLDFYANGVKLENTHNDSDYWEYTFIMPDEDVVITHKMSGGFIQVKCEDHVDEDANGSCDNCGHRHTITYVSAGESGHFENYTCGCPHDHGAVPHYDENGDYICDACGYELSDIPLIGSVDVYGGNKSISLSFATRDDYTYIVYYKLKNAHDLDYVELENEFMIADGNTFNCYISGIPAGTYNVKIVATSSIKDESFWITLTNVEVLPQE